MSVLILTIITQHSIFTASWDAIILYMTYKCYIEEKIWCTKVKERQLS